MLQETKLLPHIASPIVPGYTVVRRERLLDPAMGQQSRGGGLLTYVKESVPFRTISGYSEAGTREFENMSVQLLAGDHSFFTFEKTFTGPLFGLLGRAASNLNTYEYLLLLYSVGVISMPMDPTGI